MVLKGEENSFNLDSFFHQLKMNCAEFGIEKNVIEKYFAQIEEIKRENIWGLNREEREDA